MVRFVWVLLVSGCVCAGAACTPADDLNSARKLMEPGSYPKAQFGMAVTSVKRADGLIVVTTTGARFEIDPARSKIVCYQRLGKPRRCATITLPTGSMNGARIISKKSGAVIMDSAKARLRINCDSLVMFKPARAGGVRVSAHFAPGYDVIHGDNRLVLDNYGGFGVFLIGGAIGRVKERPAGHGEPHDSPVGLPENAPDASRGKVSMSLKPDQVIWISVCPPRPFRWEQSLRDRYFVFWTPDAESAYPYGDSMKRQCDISGCNVYVMQNEMTIWKEWQLAFEPRYGTDVFKRTLNDAHSYGCRLMVYTSPLYFTKGTPNERFAARYPVVKLGPGWGTGRNMALFLPEIRKVVNEYGADGLYFDGLYVDSLVQSYRVVREARKTLEDKRLLCVHDTWTAPGNNQLLYCPTVNAYADIQVRGEDISVLAKHPTYLRYVLSGYNISNCIGNPVGNKIPPAEFNEAFVNEILDVNARFCYGWGFTGDLGNKYYWPKLNNSLKARVEHVMAERNATIKPPAIGD